MINAGFWREEGAAMRFTHPLPRSLLTMLSPAVKILDFGCGYGRLTGELLAEGYTDIVGYDCSEALLARAQEEHPGPRYTGDIGKTAGYGFDCVLAIGLFTSCPEDDAQQRIVRDIEAATHRNSLLLISDNFICDNPRYSSRYEERQLGIYGCFRSGGAIFRHHDREHFDRLLIDWQKERECLVAAETLHGNPVVIRQLLFRRD